MTIIKDVIFIFIFLFFLPSFYYSEYIKEEIKDYRKHLEETKKELKKIKEKINEEKIAIMKEKQQEKATTKYLRKLEREIDITKREIEVFDNNLKVLNADITNIEKRIKDTNEYINQKKDVVRNILRKQYIKGHTDIFSVLLSSKSFSDFINRYKFVKILSYKNLQEVEKYKSALIQLEDDKELMLNYKKEIEEIKRQKKKQWENYKNIKWEKRLALQIIRNNIEKRKKVLNELEENSKNLSDFIEKLEVQVTLQDKSAEEAFDKFRGKFPWPVKSRNILARFGKYKHPKFGSIVYNRGIHIGTSYGEDVYSIFSGTVKYADWFDGFGKMIIIHHGGGYYSIYGHLSEINVASGQRVSMREKIGKSGDTESFYGSELYFEIRKRSTPLDPMKYLAR
ncbi:MAG: peptidoglycan DD-metalloendopeptidase family protein [Candidatus Goldbacteria bacterium]|nr:peptidoglycan DD-metalloendopeptidase family protein [Candidatus Goldiibacteriota bacterium]